MEFSSHLNLRRHLMLVMTGYINLKSGLINSSQVPAQLVLSIVDEPMEVG